MIPYKPLLDGAIELAAHKPERCVILQRPQEQATLVPGRDLDWDESSRGAPAGRVRAGGRHRPALHPLHLGHHRHAQGRRARQRRPRGRAQVVAWSTSTAWAPGEVLLGRLRHRLGGRPLLHRLRAAAQGLHDDPLRGQAGGHARSRRVLARHRPARRERAVHRAHRLPGDQEGRPAGRAHRQATTSRASARSSSPASAAIPTRSAGRASSCRCRSSTTGGRPRPAGRSPPTASGWACCRSSRARRPRPCRATTCACSSEDEPGDAGRADRLASPSSCRCRPGCLPTLWNNDAGYETLLPHAASRLLPHRRRRLSRTRTATSTS